MAQMDCVVNFFTRNKHKINKINFMQLKSQSIESLVDEKLLKQREIDLKNLSSKDRKTISEEIQSLYKAAQNLSKEKSSEVHLVKKLLSKVLSLKLGGRVGYKYFNSSSCPDFNRFILKNHIHHKAQALSLQLEEDGESPFIPLFLNGKTLQAPWDALCKVPSRRGDGYRFYYLGHLAFETDRSYQLSRKYSFTGGGVQRHDYLSSDPIIPLDRQNPAEWNYEYQLEVQIVLKDKTGSGPTLGKGDHAFLVLKNPTGEVYSIGKLRLSEKSSYKQFFSPLALKRGGIACPDVYSYLPTDDLYIYQKTFKIDQNQFDNILRVASHYRNYSSLSFSLLQDNCVTFLQKILKHILHIEVNIDMFLPSYLLKGFIPKVILKYLPFPRKRILPLWVKKLLCYFPPLYAITIFTGLGVKLLSLRSIYEKPDFTLWDVLIKPWRVSLHHPLALRDSLVNLKEIDTNS